MVVDAGGAAQIGALLGGLHLAALAQLAGCQYADGFGFAYAGVLAEVVNRHLAQGVQIVVAVGQDAFHQVDGTLLG